MAFWTLYKRELGTYFHSAVAYIVMCGSALAQSIFFTYIVSVISAGNIRTISVLQAFFEVPLFFWLLLLAIVPVITMRVFSEEFKLGTIEMLLTAPVNEWDVVIAKFLGALTFFLLLWMPIALNIASLHVLTTPPPPLIWGEVSMTALTVFLIGAFYVSMGVFSSVLTKNQIISAVVCFALIFGSFCFSLLENIPHMDGKVVDLVGYISTSRHLDWAVHGFFDTRPVVYYLSGTALFLLLTQRILEARRLKG